MRCIHFPTVVYSEFALHGLYSFNKSAECGLIGVLLLHGAEGIGKAEVFKKCVKEVNSSAIVSFCDHERGGTG